MFFLTNRMRCVTIASSILCHRRIVYCDLYLLSGKTKIVIFCRLLKSIAILTLPPGTCRSALRNTVNDVKNSLSLSYFLLRSIFAIQCIRWAGAPRLGSISVAVDCNWHCTISSGTFTTLLMIF